VIDVIDFVHGLLSFGFHILPPDFLLYMHLLMVVGLMIIFPFSKLLHAPGVFFSPTRNQIDNPREKYHVAPWAAKLGSDKE